MLCINIKISKFDKNLEEIKNYFQKGQKTTFTFLDIAEILENKRLDWGLPKTLTAPKFLKLLLENTNLKKTSVQFPHREYHRFTLGEVSIWAYCLSLIKNSYYTHRTALYIHNLVNDPPDKIYVNFEQNRSSASNNHSSLSQGRIDFAFSKAHRMSTNIAYFKGYEIILLNGQNTKMYGVIEMPFNQTKVLVTNLERTLIDIVVRPSYTHGISEILNCYRLAKERLSIDNLIKTLKKLEFVYPYHQPIGFLLEKSGAYNQDEINKLKDLGLKYNFYLAREMEEKEYSKEWKLYYPKALI